MCDYQYPPRWPVNPRYCVISWSVIPVVSGCATHYKSLLRLVNHVFIQKKQDPFLKTKCWQHSSYICYTDMRQWWQLMVFKPISWSFERVLGLQVTSLKSVDPWQQTWVVVQDLDVILFCSNMNRSFILFIKQYFQTKITNKLQCV